MVKKSGKECGKKKGDKKSGKKSVIIYLQCSCTGEGVW